MPVAFLQLAERRRFAGKECCQILGTVRSMPTDEMESRSAADGRYRTLLELSGAIATQPNLKAALESLRRLLSSVVAFDSVGLLLLSDNENSVRLVAFERGPEADEFEIGTEVPRTRGLLLDERLTNKGRYTFLTCRPSCQGFLNWLRKLGLALPTARIYFPSRHPRRNSGL
jgi:transcriptional regulator with GAF, ATPase, and Fis domain